MTKPDRIDLQKKFEASCAEADRQRAANRALREGIRDDEKAQDSLRAALIADLQRVFNDESNPYKGFAASRQRYRRLGHYPEILVEDFFGNHQEFLRAAGLADLRNTTRVRNRAALVHTHQSIADYADQFLKPYDGAFQKPIEADTFRAVVGSDFHSVFCDPFARRVWLDVLAWTQPETVVFNGDVVDFPQISRHRKLPGHFHLNVQQEIDYAREQILKPSRAAAPNANMLMVIGNHEYRLVNYFADTSPDMADLKLYDKDGTPIRMGFDTLFGLESLKIGLVCRQNFLAPFAKDRKREQMENWITIGDALVLTHGTSIAKFAAEQEMMRFQKSGTSGHTHRPQIVTGNSLGTGALNWTSTPMMASFAVGRDYVPNPSAWNMGFAVFTVDRLSRVVVPELVLIHEHFAHYAGRTWRVTAQELEARQKLWEVR